jgi:CelD/BcsL family acetyltransferase involved in cellulose biosynthesis
LILLAKDKNGELVGIAPLVYSVHHATKTIDFLGSDVCSDYLDFIIASGEEERTIKSFLYFLFDSSINWNALGIDSINRDSITLKIFQEISKIKNLYLREVFVSRCPYVCLQDTWEDYLQTLSKKSRYNVRKKKRELEKRFKIFFTKHEDLESLPQAMDTMLNLHRKRWTKEGTSSFDKAMVMHFHNEIARLFLKKGWLNLFFLHADDKPVAALYAFEYEGKVYAYQCGYDTGFSENSVGDVLWGCVVEYLISRKIKVLDFLRGDEDYKSKWGKMNNEIVQLSLYKKDLMGSISYYKPILKQRVKTLIKKGLALK